MPVEERISVGVQLMGLLVAAVVLVALMNRTESTHPPLPAVHRARWKAGQGAMIIPAHARHALSGEAAPPLQPRVPVLTTATPKAGDAPGGVVGFTIFQLGDGRSIKTYTDRCFIPCVKQYAARYNYTVDVMRVDKYDHALRAKEMARKLPTMPHGDWLVHMDMDACVADRARAFADLVAKAEAHNGGRRCDFIAQDSPHTVRRLCPPPIRPRL